jgi:hypothetical protein
VRTVPVSAVRTKRERDRSAENLERAVRRARVQSRRYILRNRLVLMWVLTYEGEGLHGPEGWDRAMADVAEFVRALRAHVGEGFAYWYGPEPHPNKKGNATTVCERDDCPCSGHGWHVNLLLSFRVEHAVVERLWGHGHVWVTDWRKKIGRRRPGQRRAALRAAASYCCKYVAKDFGEAFRGRHRYERAQGFNPEKVSRQCGSRDEAFGAACGVFGGELPERSSYSWEWAEWDGPPVEVHQWAA